MSNEQSKELVARLRAEADEADKYDAGPQAGLLREAAARIEYLERCREAMHAAIEGAAKRLSIPSAPVPVVESKQPDLGSLAESILGAGIPRGKA